MNQGEIRTEEFDQGKIRTEGLDQGELKTEGLDQGEIRADQGEMRMDQGWIRVRKGRKGWIRVINILPLKTDSLHCRLNTLMNYSRSSSSNLL